MLDFVEFLSSDSDFEDNDVEENQENDEEDQNKRNIEKPETCIKPKQHHHIIDKDENVALIKQLSTHIMALEREIHCQLYGRKQNDDDDERFKELRDIQNKFKQQRKAEHDSLKDNLARTSNKLDKFQRDKVYVQKNATSIYFPLLIFIVYQAPIQRYGKGWRSFMTALTRKLINLDKLKILMEDIEANIMQCKEKQKIIYEDLIEGEKNLTSEMEKLSKKFEGWSKIKHASYCDVENHKENKNTSNNIPEEVTTFEKFVHATGGHLGGWDDYDHQTFLKLFKQHKKQEILLDAAESNIPTRSKDEIVDHVQWYKQYLDLRKHKREAIRKWKTLKTHEKEELLLNVSDVIDMDDQKKKRREALFEKERQQRMEDLREWKEKQKLQAQNLSIEEDHQQSKLKKVLEEKRRLQTKLEIQEYKLKKLEEKEILDRVKEKQTNTSNLVSEVERSRIKERNEKHFQHQKIQKMNRELENKQKEERLQKLKEKVVVNVDRDPSRLFKPTEGLIRRQKDTEDASNRVQLNTGTRALPHRAIPIWRQNVS